MKLAEKEYKIIKLNENGEEYLIDEVFWILGIELWGTYHSEDGISGAVPFKDYFSAEKRMKELQKIEKSKVLDREIKVIFSSVGVLLVGVFYILHKMNII